MTKKDPNISENIDLDNAEKTHNDHSVKTDQPTSESKTEGQTEIKNAHATGDGAYGRSDKSVLENEGESGKEETPPY